MSQASVNDETWQFTVQNIGGIDETSIEFSPGVTILTGRNATNRTSLLQAIIAVLGSDTATIKGDAEEGSVKLTIGDRTYTRRLQRRGDTIVTSGDPYLEDATLADLFAFLLETNEARQAVASQDDLRDIIMEPVDTAEIKSQIDQLQSERDRLDDQLDTISSLKRELPDLEKDRAQIEDTISDKRDELTGLEEKIENIDENVTERKQEKKEFEQKLDELNDIRNELESVRHQLESEQSSLEALHDEQDDLEAEQTNYDEIPDGRIDGINAEIQRLRKQKSHLDAKLDKLQTVIEFNDDLLDGSLDVFADAEEGETSDVTDKLLEDDEIVCWTCGSEVTTSHIEQMVDRLRDIRNEQMSQRNEIDESIDDLNGERKQLEEEQRQRRQIDTRLDRIQDEIDERKTRIEELKDRKSEFTNEVEELEAEVDNLQSDNQKESELLELHKEANRLEVEIDRLESDRDEIEQHITDIESQIDDQDDIEARREGLQSDIEDLRTRVETLEQEAVDQFNTHMESILKILEYENLERVWIERTEEQVREGRQTITKGRFDLHVVRGTEAGTVYEDTIDHLSESEREVTGLVFALAGYLVHDVYEQVPAILLDSVEAIDAPRLAALVNYFEDYADYLIAALLKDDAQVLDDDYQRIAEI